MKRIEVLTLFPEMFSPVTRDSILGKAGDRGEISVEVHNIRDYTLDRHQKTDDYPFGGGAGMVLYAEPIFRLLRKLGTEGKKLFYLSPRGAVLTQAKVMELAGAKEDLILLCGHYEGVDQRVLDHFQIEEISIGDYILTGGELPAMVLIDAVARYLPGVLGNEEALREESICSGLLEYPQYTKPRNVEGLEVPSVLLEGHHRKIHLWQFEKSLRLTAERRPDLLQEYLKKRAKGLEKDELRVLEQVLMDLQHPGKT